MRNFDIKIIERILRTGIFLTFLGHGIIAIQGNPSWIKYLETVWIPKELAQNLIVYIGYLDIIVAGFVLFRPYKGIIIWAIIWAFSTAIIRPISGESIWSFVERGANWVAPLCLYLIMNYKVKDVKN